MRLLTAGPAVCFFFFLSFFFLFCLFFSLNAETVETMTAFHCSSQRKGKNTNFGSMTGNCAHKSYMVPGDPEIRSTAAHMTASLL